MDVLANLALGFSAAFTVQNLAYCFMGCLLGTVIGVLPGLGPLATIAMLLPFSFGLDPLAALIMLAGVYYGAQYGGSTTAILVSLPGETSSVVTMIDGYEMAKRGRAGVALSTAALASFFAGCVGTVFLAAFAKPLSSMALDFGPAELFALMVVGLVGASAMSSGSIVKSLGMIVFGIMFGLIGTDITSGAYRFTFGVLELQSGVELVAVAIGIFAFTEVISQLEQRETAGSFGGRIERLMPSLADVKRMIAPALRGTALGVVVGALPGAGPSIASFGSYAMEKRFSRHKEELGSGAIEGVAGPEAGNNAAAQCAFVPTLTLGIPGSATMALLLSVMVMNNIQPGPQVINSNPDLFWGLIASMWIGNLILLVLNLPLVGIWVKLLKIPYPVLYPAILTFSCIGVYSVNNSVFDVYVTVFFAVIGYLLRKLRFEPAPIMLGFVLGPMMEQNFRTALLISRGDFSIFVKSTISMGLLGLAVLLLLLMRLPVVRRIYAKTASEEV
jgi:putative tricarboxylic transport membrane protein